MAKPSKKKAASDGGDGVAVSVRNSPRARASVRRIRALGGLLGLLFGGWMGWQQTADPFVAGIGALAGWLIANLLFWWAAIIVWQVALGLEVEDRRRQMVEMVQQQRLKPKPAPASPDSQQKDEPQ